MASATECAPCTETHSPTQNRAVPRPIGTQSVILVVEDSGIQREMITRALRREDLQLLQASDGAQAISMIQSVPRIDLMILDYELPDMSGDQVVDELTTGGVLPPFVVSTARGTERVAVQMMKRGAVDYLIKDERLLSSLPAIVDRLLRQLKQDRIITETQSALRRSEQRLREVVDSTADAFISISHDGSVLEWNKSAETMFELRRDQALGIDAIEQIVPPDRREELRRLLQQFRESPTQLTTRIHQEAAAVDAAGRLFPVEVSLSTVEANGEWVINAFVQDISRRRQLEAQLVQSDKMASLGQLAAGVAHEINNPIAYVRSNLSTMRDYVRVFTTLIGKYERMETVAAGESDELRQIVADIKKWKADESLSEILADSADVFQDSDEGLVRVKEIVQNLKSFARLDEAEVKEADLNECLETTLKVVANEIKYKAEVICDFAELPRLRCHPGQLNQVFMNLLVNAGQAITERGEIYVTTGFDDQNIYVSVRDTGVGIPPEHLPFLFTPFFTTKPVGSGTGLGLSISYGIVQKHRGEITVESVQGQGTTFRIRLPREGVEA